MLSKSELKTALLAMLESGFETLDDATQAWSDLYDTYANGGSSFAQDQSTDRVMTANPTGFKAGLQTAFVAGNPGGCASGMEISAMAYWTGGIFGITTPPLLLDPTAISDISAIVSNPGFGLSAELQAIFAVLSDDADAKADQIATAFDNHAKSVQVLCTYLASLPSPPFITTKTITLSVS